MAKIKVAGPGRVREVTLARSEKRNALDAEMLAALTEAFSGAPDPAERVTVIRAEGPVFCSGLDLRERGGGTIGSFGHRDHAACHRGLSLAGCGGGAGRRYRRRQRTGAAL